MSQDQLATLAKKLMAMITRRKDAWGPSSIHVEHRMQYVTRITNGQVMTSDDGDHIEITFDNNVPLRQVKVTTNQLTDGALRAIADRFSTVDQAWPPDERIFGGKSLSQDTYAPARLWHDATVQAMHETRATLVPDMIRTIAGERLQAAGFIGFLAKSSMILTRDGNSAFSEETDSEFTVTARTLDGKTSGWGGAAARDWSRVDAKTVIAHATDMCKRGVGVQAVEPGRRTAILTSEAVIQAFRYLAFEFDAYYTIDMHMTPFYSATHPGHARYGERMFDARITMNSDPADPDGGYCPYFWNAFANAPTTWVKDGVFKELAWSPYMATTEGRDHYAENPQSIRISGGTTSVEQMIANCEEGIFVNRLSDVELLDTKTGMLSGVTRDGCFLVKNGKIDRPVKNFRFMDSPFFMLNRIAALGPTKRAAFGYTPPGFYEQFLALTPWPRLPIIAPPMMINDFNFVAIADSV